MSPNAEFIQNWNEIFQFKIKESDLYAPNETFLTNVLLHYIEKFNFDFSLLIKAKDNEIQENRRKFKIELCAYIDYLYKSGNEASNSFLYYDLIAPTQKKTVHLLKYLLNYLFFYNLMKEEIIGPTEDKIIQRSELLEKQSTLVLENEKKQYLAKSIAKTLEEYRIMLPTLTQKLNNLEIKERKQNDKKKRLEASLENYKAQLIDIKKEEHNKLCNVVSEEETNNLFVKKKHILKLIAVQTETEQAIKITERERTNSIAKLESLIKKLERAIIILNLKDITKLKELKQAHHILFEKVKEQKINNDIITSLTEKNIKVVEKCNIVLNSTKKEIEQFEKLSKEEILNREKSYESAKLNNVKYSDMNDLNAELTEQKEIRDIMVTSAEKLINHLLCE